MAFDEKKLEDIFGMVSSAEEIGQARTSTIAKGNNKDIIAKILELIFSNDSNGAKDIADLETKIKDLRTQSGTQQDAEKAALLDYLINIYTPSGFSDKKGYAYTKPDSNQITYSDVVGEQSPNVGHKTSFILCRTPYITPQVRNARHIEMFMNYMPPMFVSRLQPYLSLDFQFDRQVLTSDSKKHPLSTASLMKFLLGNQEIDMTGATTPNQVMVNAQNTIVSGSTSTTSGDRDRVISRAGMELFTSPQTLVNMDINKTGGKYVKVLDPTRPFASLENVAISVVSSGAGMFSFKKATAVIKLHDRSRLSEVADLIQPTTYTRTTVWLTYGYVYANGGMSKNESPYADFVNNNMLVKEAFGVRNASFSFEHSGQVSINLELYTKGMTEIRDIKLPDDPESYDAIVRKLEEAAKEIKRLRIAAGIENPSGVNKEIRAFTYIDAAERGTFPDDGDKTPSVIESVNTFINQMKDQKGVNFANAQEFANKIKEYYESPNKSDGKKQQLKNAANRAIKKKFSMIKSGYDPFLMTPARL